MFDKERLDRLLALHDKSYRLFNWANEGLRSGPRLAAATDGSTLAEAAGLWMRRNAAAFPADLRPATDEVDELAHLFVSYLATSFEVVETRFFRTTCAGCFCCGYWQSKRHLRRQRPGRKAQADARELQVLYVRGLSLAMGLTFSDADLGAFVRDRRDIREELALSTYVHELDRRSSFGSQGEGILVLWRAFAWKDGKLRRRFRLTAEGALSAEEAVRSRLIAHADGLGEKT